MLCVKTRSYEQAFAMEHLALLTSDGDAPGMNAPPLLAFP